MGGIFLHTPGFISLPDDTLTPFLNICNSLPVFCTLTWIISPTEPELNKEADIVDVTSPLLLAKNNEPVSSKLSE